MDRQNSTKAYGGYTQQENRTDAFKEFDATQLYCSRCKQAVPVRKRLLLVLPEGDKYEYLCAFCLETVGTKMDKNGAPVNIIV
ncbi:MAG: cytoplasmic protein [Desulfobacterales bacterium]|uniref:Cytoplasmic protein n=1 Tax=Candidatus Desulfaltia bathyphila TaxID=2841697 RepID=A0A8J6T7L9_9BACT|nr:cytoplasmic protein [Candidatus Desulfaltia bathyphila]MBL7207969.1 cytoplasmic protein [Desulfobacterales bacterium]